MIVTKNITLASLALAGLGALTSGSALAASMTVDSNGGLEVFELSNQDYWFKLGGRIHVNNVWAEGGETDRSRFPSGSEIRRARISLKGGVGTNWVYKFDADFLDQTRRLRVSDGYPDNNLYGDATDLVYAESHTNFDFGEAFVGYIGCRNFWVALGQVSVPFGLEAWASANDLTFMEEAMPTQAFAPDYGLGVYVEWHGDMFTAAGAVFHPRAGRGQSGDSLILSDPTNPKVTVGSGVNFSDPGSDPWGASFRLTFSPQHDNYAAYHLGFSVRYQDLQDNANVFNFVSGMEVRSRQMGRVFTNIPAYSAKDFMVYGLEAAGRWGALHLAGEYMYTKVERDSYSSNVVSTTGSFPDRRGPGGDLTFDGYYISASYVITGEAKEYDFVSGTFGRVRPKSKKGAWEIAVRHSYVNLLDNAAFAADSYPTGFFGPIYGTEDTVGSASSTTVGLNWWVNDNVRFLANYARASLPQDIDADLFGISAQVRW